MIPVAEARARILAALSPLPAETVGLADAAGRVLAAPQAARLTQPPADVSAMDGYAVWSADASQAPARLSLGETLPAGQVSRRPLAPGEAARIFTGAALPAGADAVVLQEDAEAAEGWVILKVAAEPGRHVRRRGLDFSAGDPVLVAGRCLTPRDIGLLAAMNIPWVPVIRRPRIAILATGDEIVLPGEPIGPGQIVSANSLLLAAMVRAAGAEAVLLGVVPDRVEALVAAAAAAAGADLLVTTGGASVGDHDLVGRVLGADRLDFWKIAMRPGKPLMFGRSGAVPLLGLPGNPVSTAVCALLFLRPALFRLLGRDPADALPSLPAVTGAPLGANDRREDYLRARLERDPAGQRVATPFPVQDSSMMTRLALADCLIRRPPHHPALPAGAPVEILPLDGI